MRSVPRRLPGTRGRLTVTGLFEPYQNPRPLRLNFRIAHASRDSGWPHDRSIQSAFVRSCRERPECTTVSADGSRHVSFSGAERLTVRSDSKVVRDFRSDRGARDRSECGALSGRRAKTPGPGTRRALSEQPDTKLDSVRVYDPRARGEACGRRSYGVADVYDKRVVAGPIATAPPLRDPSSNLLQIRRKTHTINAVV
jgi:hypothetical protein